MDSAPGATEYDADLIKDFEAEVSDAYSDIEATLIALEKNPTDRAVLDDLFRQIHSVKSNMRMMELGPIGEFIHVVEDVLDRIRASGEPFNSRDHVFLVNIFSCIDQQTPSIIFVMPESFCWLGSSDETMDSVLFFPSDFNILLEFFSYEAGIDSCPSRKSMRHPRFS